jgi:hypothetical protein
MASGPTQVDPILFKNQSECRFEPFGASRKDENGDWSVILADQAKIREGVAVLDEALDGLINGEWQPLRVLATGLRVNT